MDAVVVSSCGYCYIIIVIIKADQQQLPGKEGADDEPPHVREHGAYFLLSVVKIFHRTG